MIQPTTPAEFSGTERFRVVRRIGSGGMGVVYEAFDRQREARVALKFLPDADATALSRFKQEFRVLADVSDPHLIQLYELFSDQDQWFFTMEFIEGLDFLTHLRGAKVGGHASATQRSQPTQTESQSCPQIASEQTLVYEEGTDSPKRADLSERQIECLRDALRQLVEAVERLHSLGILHRDLKPTNVLVAENGRVVVLDFGLAAELHDPHDDAAIGSGVSDVAGTVAYMSPEQVRGRTLTPASDWYNVGVMLYELLTGRRPFSGHSQQIMLAKTAFDPPEPKSLVPSVPDDLNELCMDLLCRAPQNRADGKRILAVCGATASEAAAPSAHGLFTRHEFVGRQKELEELSIAFARVREGRSSVVLIEGESGVGKSALVHRFLDEQARAGQLALTGRCYEQESVPFKAFDALIDALTRHLASLPTADAAALLPRDILALAKIFPVLAQVPAVAAAPARRAEVPDHRELRRRAFAALRELLARMGDRRPLVLVIDDLQWGDVDSANLLNELLEPPDPPPFLFIGAYRHEDVDRSACLQILRQAVATGENVARTTLSLAPLNHDECIELATCLLESEDTLAQGHAEEIVKESRGSPYFVCELAQHVREGIHIGAAAETGAAAGIRLEDALWQRIQRLPSAERAVLEVLSIAARPLPPVDAFAAAGTDEPLGLLARLRSDRLIRVALTGGDELLAPYHDRLRETIRSRLPASAAAERHRALATVLKRAKEPDAQLLAVHFEGAGELEVAGGYYALAADAANVSLAFDRAAQLYRKSLELKPLAADDRAAMLCKLADALANAGRGAEAGQQYLAAAAAAPSWQALMLRGKAGFQFCAAGDIDAGRESLAEVLRGLGLSLPATHYRALLSLLLNRCRLRLRGIRFRERREPDVPGTLLSRVDVTWSVAVGLTMIDTIRGADFQTRNLLLALRTGEPYRIARAMAWEATHVAMGGVAGRRRARHMLDAAGQIAERLGHPHARGMTMMGRGVSAYFLGDWREAQETCDRAVRAFNEDCTGASWELDTSQAFAYWSLFWLGRFAEIQSRYARLVSEARERGDRLAVANFTTFGGPFVFLSQDDPAAAEAALDSVMGAWSRQDFHVQHFTTLSARTYVELYRRNACGAWQNLLAEWPRLRASFLLNVECVRVYMRHLRASCALAAAADPQTPRSHVPELEREAQRDARRLERERPRYARPLAMMIRAALAARAGQSGQASDLLAGAIPLLDNHQLGIYSAAARFRRGQLLGGDFGDGLLEQATESIRQEKVVNPGRIVALFAPGRD